MGKIIGFKVQGVFQYDCKNTYMGFDQTGWLCEDWYKLCGSDCARLFVFHTSEDAEKFLRDERAAYPDPKQPGWFRERSITSVKDAPTKLLEPPRYRVVACELDDEKQFFQGELDWDGESFTKTSYGHVRFYPVEPGQFGYTPPGGASLQKEP